MPPTSPCEGHGEMERRLREIEHAGIRSEKDLATILRDFSEIKEAVRSLRNWQISSVAVFGAGTFAILNWEKIKAFLS